MVIDDQDYPYIDLFSRDGYHISRWAEIEDLQRLTEGSFDVILLDINGVGLRESPRRQGLGILEHIKKTNPAQAVILYSAKPQGITNRGALMAADRVLDKGDDYVIHKEAIDELLQQRYTTGYYIAVMNSVLDTWAATAPKAVPKALKALKSSNTGQLKNYLSKSIPDTSVVDRTLQVISTGAAVLGLFLR